MTIELISALANVVIATGVIIGIRQVKLLAFEIKADHDKSRREMAIELISQWANTSDELSVGLCAFVESLNANGCEALWNKHELSVDADHAGFLSQFSKAELPISGAIVKLDSDSTRRVRSYIVDHLNRLEAISCAWRYNVADQEMLEEEFKSILLHGGDIVMNNFVSRTGIYPSLKLMTQALQKKALAGSIRAPSA